MVSSFGRTCTHDEERRHSYEVLAQARHAATQKCKYNSNATREKIIKTFHDRFHGKSPYDWQVDVSEALLLGLDCTVVAGTGSGKTMPFVMPTFVKNKIIFVISPLNALERDQVSRFSAMGIAAAAVNHETCDEDLLKDIKQGKYQVILTSPEMLESPRFRQLMTDTRFCARIGTLVIDEAHCISQWGGDFRKDYGHLDKLRSFVPLNIPVLATSATLTPAALTEVRSKLKIRARESFHINLGNDRANVKQEVRFMRSASDYKALDFIVSGVKQEQDIPRTIVFVNSIVKCHAVAQHLRGVLGESLKSRVGILHAKRTAYAKRREWERFQNGEIKILVATEAAAMGMDVADIKLVVQFGVALTLAVWIQRAGRAGRSPELQARAVMLVELSVTQKSNKSRGAVQVDPAREKDNTTGQDIQDPEEQPEDYKKNVEEPLRRWIEVKSCRRIVVDEYFDNPPRPVTVDSLLCCDNCAEQARRVPMDGKTGSQDALVVEHDMTGVDDEDAEDDIHSSEGDNASGAEDSTSTLGVLLSPKKRTREHLENVKAALREWRLTTRRTRYAHTSLTAPCLLPDANLKTIASNRRGIKTIEDLRAILKPPWPFLDIHGAEVLALVKKLDNNLKAQQHAASAARKRAAEERQELRAEAKRAKRSAKRELERQQAQWARTQPGYGGVLGTTAILNAPLLHPQHVAQGIQPLRGHHTWPAYPSFVTQPPHLLPQMGPRFSSYPPMPTPLPSYIPSSATSSHHPFLGATPSRPPSDSDIDTNSGAPPFSSETGHSC